MAATAETSPLGQQVEIGRIEKELKKLWAQNEGAMTRASLINLAVYSEEPGSLERNTKWISQLTENNACRALVIGADPTAKENRAEAWINAHCHVSRAGSKQICTEQLSFSIAGPCTSLLPSLVFSHLDSDLPFYLWWQGELHDPMDSQLWAWVDRLIYDSQQWSDFAGQIRLVEQAQQEAKQRVVLCDLNWTRLDKVRLALAQFFDHPSSHHHFLEMENVRIGFGAGYRSTAKLLAGWLAAQLAWLPAKTTAPADRLEFTDQKKRKIEITLKEQGSAPITEVLVSSGNIEFLVKPAKYGDLLEVSRAADGQKHQPQLMPAQANNPVDLLGQELLRGGPHRVYLRALNCVRSWL
jgi:glucose-6-phosphate dehydrogenase assembly protein OpcA